MALSDQEFIFIWSSAAGGNVQIVQLLCELKCPINQKDTVCSFTISSALSSPHVFFLWNRINSANVVEHLFFSFFCHGEWSSRDGVVYAIDFPVY